MSLFRFLFQTLDPVHVGIGGYRLGRVDLPIAREPGTNLPKIPGTGLSGAARQYAAIRVKKLQCAGQGAVGDETARGHCGVIDACPICHTFGTLRALKNGESIAVAGRVRIFDARLLLFPVATFQGPAWVTSPQTLKDFGLKDVPEPERDKVLVSPGLKKELGKGSQTLNLGWLVVNVKGEYPLPKLEETAVLLGALPVYMLHRIVLVSDALFSTVVNSNLEVRTSVSIDPETGAAREGALFTYEALPRATFLFLDVVEEKRILADGGVDEGPFSNGGWPKKGSEDAETAELSPGAWKSPIDVVEAGFRYFEFLGVGGMTTRGFGRLRQIGCREVQLK